MKKDRHILLWSLAALSGVLMSLPFLVPHTGFISLFALVPLLFTERIASLQGLKHQWRWHYCTFVIWNALSTFWVCNATVAGGIFAILANAFQMSLTFGLFHLSRKHFGGALPYIFLAVAWTAWERFYFSAEISWPWLTLGNAFARSAENVQWYEYTGSLGGSLWIWACNLALFGLMWSLAEGNWFIRLNNKAKATSLVAVAGIIIVPFIVSANIYNKVEDSADTLEVVVPQPNFDPYQKFESLSRSTQDEILRQQIENALASRKADSTVRTPLLVLSPETFTSFIKVNAYREHKTWSSFTNMLKNYPGVNMMLGATTVDFLFGKEAPSYTARKLGDDCWIECHNSALMIDGTERTEFFHKSRLVVGVEKTPYPAIFCKLDDLLGGVMGRDIGQDEVSVLHCCGTNGESIPIGSIICYESVYGEYCTEYVKKGAKALAIITNDAWWGNTPGYVQHLNYARLRAIETRRSIARCANTGISAFINSRGDIIQQTNWWEKDCIRGEVGLSDEMTFFVLNGDICGRVATFLFLLLLAALFVRIIITKMY